MGRPRKQGLDYFPVDSDIFDDFSIRILIAKYGCDGYALYMYILTKCYKENGYYLAVDEDLEYIVSSDLKMSIEKVRQVLTYLYNRSLLSKIETKSMIDAEGKLITPVTVITSTGIQRRFQEAVKGRAQKNPVEVKEEFWLLEEKETAPFIKVLPSLSFSGKNPSNSEKNVSYSQKKCIKKSKEKKSKEKESISIPAGSQYLQDDGANEEFERYLAMRRETETLSDAQIHGLIGKLIEITEDPAKQRAVIREAVIHRWKSFFPVKEGNGRNASGSRPKGSFYNFEQRQRSADEMKQIENALLGAPPTHEGAG